MRPHIGNPCVFCNQVDVFSESCPGNIISRARLDELARDVKEAMIGRTEARLLVSAYRLLQSLKVTCACCGFDDGWDSNGNCKYCAQEKSLWDYTCAHCARDMRSMKTHERCSNGGLCVSIEDINAERLHKLQESLSEPNNGFISLEQACEPVVRPELTDEILGWYADGRFYEEVKHRGQELSKELLSTRIQLRAAKLALRMQNPQGISRA